MSEAPTQASPEPTADADRIERDWLTSPYPERLVEILDRTGANTHRGAPRKLRLFAAACCRAGWGRLTDGRIGVALQVAERHAQGRVTADELAEAEDLAVMARRGHRWFSADCNGAKLAEMACHRYLWAAPESFLEVCQYATRLQVTRAEQAAFLRDLIGNPIRLPQLTDTAGWLAGGDGTPHRWARGAIGTPGGDVRAVALAIQATNLLRTTRVLARTLFEAGAASQELISHCAGKVRCAACLGVGVTDGPGCEACGRRGWIELPECHVVGCWAIDLLLGF
jgi:hypothetical protein